MGKKHIAQDVEAVITSYNQGTMVLEALHSLCSQTTVPAGIIIVDDGSTDEQSVHILEQIGADLSPPVPVAVHRQPNGGVSAARNAGIRMTQAPMVLVLDGDDKVAPSYVEEVSGMLRSHSSMVAASSWMQTFGVLDAVVRPAGGKMTAFLSRNCCPATHILRRDAWEQCGGYDESMRSGFEDWDFFLSLLETAPEAAIGIVEKPLINYRTAPASANVKSMTKRLELMRFLIEKHACAYQRHMADAILDVEAISMARLYGWESEMLHSMQTGQALGEESEAFMRHPSYGDGGMAAAVRIASGCDAAVWRADKLGGKRNQRED